MKKVLMTMALVVLAAFARAATNTPTPNATQTAAQTQIQQTQTAIAATATYIATAFPTLTPTNTLTPGGTVSPTLSPTPAPKQIKSDFRHRIYFQPNEFLNVDSSQLTAVSASGGVNVWLTITAQGQAAAVMSTGSAETRLNMTIPWDYKGDGKLFLYMNAMTVGDSLTITASVNVQDFNCTTQTVGVFSYTPPRGGNFTITGAATQLVAGYGGQAVNPLWDTPVQVVSRVQMPLANQAYAYWNTLPTLSATIRHGSIVNFDIKRTTGGSGNIQILGVEYSYDFYTDQEP